MKKFLELCDEKFDKEKELFEKRFEIITINKPFPFQRDLFVSFLKGFFPRNWNIPTGLGKTSIIQIWILALDSYIRNGIAGFPLHLVYVNNLRVLVDQATSNAEQLFKALNEKEELNDVVRNLKKLVINPENGPLAISTLRGQFADNEEWCKDPFKPSIIVGTPDMIGSSLLVNGYGCGPRKCRLRAGLLGQNTLLVYDDAHLGPAFDELITEIKSEQEKCGDIFPLKIMSLTATSRKPTGDDHKDNGIGLGLTEDDFKNEEIKRRIEAEKKLKIHFIEDEFADKVVELSLQYKESGKTILVYLERLEDITNVVKKLRKKSLKVQELTGTLRGLERDNLINNNPIFARFKIGSENNGETVFLVCTSAGEVGIDISADVIICDLVTLERFLQRLGRGNRTGNSTAEINVVCKNNKDGLDYKLFKQERENTLSLLRKLPFDGEYFDASPKALNNLLISKSFEELQNAFTPLPNILHVDNVLFDTWALTSIRQKISSPPVARWLHGVAEWGRPETYVAWRKDVEIIKGELFLEKYPPDELLDIWSLKSCELLRDHTDRILENIKLLAERFPEEFVWVVKFNGEVEVLLLSQLVNRYEHKKNKWENYNKNNKNKGYFDYLDKCTILLPPRVGRLVNQDGCSIGIFDGKSIFNELCQYDVSEQWKNRDGNISRKRIFDNKELPDDMFLIKSIYFKTSDGEDHYWNWYIKSSGSKIQRNNKPQELEFHHKLAKEYGIKFCEKLGLILNKPKEEIEVIKEAIIYALDHHDDGKNRKIWQCAILNKDYPEKILAKSSKEMINILNHYRHEFGSVLDCLNDPEFNKLQLDVQDLVLHLISITHNRGRPSLSFNERFDPKYPEFDPKYPEFDTDAVAIKITRCFDRLQRKYGRWGLLWLESIMLIADAKASNY